MDLGEEITIHSSHMGYITPAIDRVFGVSLLWWWAASKTEAWLTGWDEVKCGTFRRARSKGQNTRCAQNKSLYKTIRTSLKLDVLNIVSGNTYRRQSWCRHTSPEEQCLTPEKHRLPCNSPLLHSSINFLYTYLQTHAAIPLSNSAQRHRAPLPSASD